MPTEFPHDAEATKVYLTPTEKKVLSLIAEGFTSREVGARLVVSSRTIDFHMTNIFQKLFVNNRISAIKKATKLGLIEPV